MLTADIVSQLGARFFEYELEATLPSADGSLQAIPQQQIQAGYHFVSEVLNIEYDTLAVVDDVEVDDGVCHFSGQFKSGSNQIALSNAPINFSTIATPGRRRTRNVDGDPGQALYIQGFPFFYFWEATGSIMVDLRKEDTSATESITFVWTGWIIPVSRCATAEAFYGLLAGSLPGFGANPNGR